jgi:hypothetical protein
VLLLAVAGFGAATVLFGAARSLGTMLPALALTGSADMVSMVIRSTVRQTLTPDSLRGRVAGLDMLFFFGRPQLGEIEAGIAARLLGAPLSVILGGAGCLLAAGWITAATPELRAYRGDLP